MLHYPSIENHYNKKNLDFWLNKHPELKNISCVAQQKYDGSNLGIEITEDNKVNFYSRNQQINDKSSFYGLEKALFNINFNFLSETIIKWKSNNPEIKTVHLFGELYGPGIQKRIHYGTEKRIKFFDVFFNRKIQTPFYFREWMKQLNFSDVLVEYFLIGTLEELLNGLDQCKKIAKNSIEGIVIKTYEQIFWNINGHPFRLKLKVEGFEDMHSKNISLTHKKQETSENERNIIDYITENRIQDCKGKQPWTNSGDLVKLVVQDAYDDFKKNLNAIEENIVIEELTPNERKNLSRKAFKMCQNLYNLTTGELL